MLSLSLNDRKFYYRPAEPAVQWQLPDPGMWSPWTVQIGTVGWNCRRKVEGKRPRTATSAMRSDHERRVVFEARVRHHSVLRVSASFQEWSAHSAHILEPHPAQFYLSRRKQ